MRLGLVLVLCFLAVLSLPLWNTQAIVFLAGLILIDALFALSWNLMFGFTGVTTFGHAAFFAIGAYGTAVMLKFNYPVPFLLQLVVVAALGAVASAIVGLIALRRTVGIAFAIFTMALGEILKIFLGYSDQLGREDGIAAVPRPRLDFGFFEISLRATVDYYWFICVIVAVGAGILASVTFSSFGRVLRSIRQDGERTAFLGINVDRYRLIAFTIAGGMAAVAGGLYTPWVQTITPDIADAFKSAAPMLNSLLGGPHHFLGPIVGTVLFAFFNYSTRTLPGISELVVGIVLLVVILAAPTGVLGLVDMGWKRLRKAVSK
jgi:branched-chain amino acid transport system permease protein